MIDLDKWQEIYATAKRHKLRSTLTAFGVFWGIFMLVILLGAGRGLENGVTGQFGGNVNQIYFWTGTTSYPYKGLAKGRRIQFNDADVAAIRQNIPDVDLLLPLNSAGGLPVMYEDKSEGYPIRGAHQESNQIMAFEVTFGRFINQFDVAQRRKVAVIGSQVATVLFGPEVNPVGKAIEIKGIPFLVVGTARSTRTGGGNRNENENVFIPNSTLRHTFNQANYVQQMVLTPQNPDAAGDLEQRVKKLLAVRHKVHPEDTVAIRSFNVQEEYDKVQGLFTGIALFSWLVAIGTILAGVIGVGNIMLIIVKERTKEIGIRKALGATPFSIVMMVIQEALTMTGVAGYFGLVMGVLLLETINSGLQASGGGGQFFANPEIDFQVAVTAIIVLMIAGTLAALMPAYKAAMIDPVKALQSD